MTSKNYNSVFIDFEVKPTKKRNSVLPALMFLAFPVIILLCGVVS